MRISRHLGLYSTDGSSDSLGPTYISWDANSVHWGDYNGYTYPRVVDGNSSDIRAWLINENHSYFLTVEGGTASTVGTYTATATDYADASYENIFGPFVEGASFIYTITSESQPDPEPQADLYLYNEGSDTNYTWDCRSGQYNVYCAEVEEEIDGQKTGKKYLLLRHHRDDTYSDDNKGFILNQTVDLTQYNYLKCEVVRNLATGYGQPTLGVIDHISMSDDAEISVKTADNNQSGRYIVSLDISSLTGSYYVRLKLNGRTKVSYTINNKYYKVWLTNTQ